MCIHTSCRYKTCSDQAKRSWSARKKQHEQQGTTLRVGIKKQKGRNDSAHNALHCLYEEMKECANDIWTRLAQTDGTIPASAIDVCSKQLQWRILMTPVNKSCFLRPAYCWWSSTLGASCDSNSSTVNKKIKHCQRSWDGWASVTQSRLVC